MAARELYEINPISSSRAFATGIVVLWPRRGRDLSSTRLFGRQEEYPLRYINILAGNITRVESYDYTHV